MWGKAALSLSSTKLYLMHYYNLIYLSLIRIFFLTQYFFIKLILKPTRPSLSLYPLQVFLWSPFSVPVRRAHASIRIQLFKSLARAAFPYTLYVNSRLHTFRCFLILFVCWIKGTFLPNDVALPFFEICLLCNVHFLCKQMGIFWMLQNI